jgi:hypothetical protein
MVSSLWIVDRLSAIATIAPRVITPREAFVAGA